MIIRMGHRVYECTTAEKYKDGVHLFDENGKLLIILGSPEYITSVEGGEIIVVEEAEPTQLDRIEAQIAFTAMMTNTLLED